MNRAYWLKFGGCCAFFALLVAGKISEARIQTLPWPWNGIAGMVLPLAEVLSPFVLIYLVVLVNKLK